MSNSPDPPETAGKAPSYYERRAANKDKDYFVLKKPLNTILRPDLSPLFTVALDSAVENTNKILHLASKLINFHIIRLIQESKDEDAALPNIDKTFVDRACQLIAPAYSRDSCADPELTESFRQLMGGWPVTERPDRSRLIDTVQAGCETYVVNVRNSIIANFKRLLKRYIFEVTSSTSGVLKGVFTDEYADGDRTVEAFRAFVRFYPLTDKTILANMSWYLNRYYDLLVYFNGKSDSKRYSLLPIKSSFIWGHVQITNTTADDLQSRINHLTKEEAKAEAEAKKRAEKEAKKEAKRKAKEETAAKKRAEKEAEKKASPPATEPVTDMDTTDNPPEPQPEPQPEPEPVPRNTPNSAVISTSRWKFFDIPLLKGKTFESVIYTDSVSASILYSCDKRPEPLEDPNPATAEVTLVSGNRTKGNVKSKRGVKSNSNSSSSSSSTNGNDSSSTRDSNGSNSSNSSANISKRPCLPTPTTHIAGTKADSIETTIHLPTTCDRRHPTSDADMSPSPHPSAPVLSTSSTTQAAAACPKCSKSAKKNHRKKLARSKSAPKKQKSPSKKKKKRAFQRVVNESAAGPPMAKNMLPPSSELPLASKRSKRARGVSNNGPENNSKQFKSVSGKKINRDSCTDSNNNNSSATTADADIAPRFSSKHDDNVNRNPGRVRKRDPSMYYNSYNLTSVCMHNAKGNVVLSEPSATQVAIIGIDPGIRSPITAYFLKPATTADATRQYMVFQLTLREWRNKSGITVATRQRALYHLKMQESLSSAEKALPSLKTLNLDTYRSHINCLQPIFTNLYDFYHSEPYLQLRSSSYSRRQRALANICNSILALGGDATKIIIGFGNFSQRPGSPVNKGNPSSPIKTIKRVISPCIIYFIYLLTYLLAFFFS